MLDFLKLVRYLFSNFMCSECVPETFGDLLDVLILPDHYPAPNPISTTTYGN